MKIQMKINASILLLVSGIGNAAVIDQWADGVVDYSTQWNSSTWAAARATGAPDSTLGLGDPFADAINAWAPSTTGGGEEWIVLDYATAVYATDVAIRETDGGGFVTKIELVDISDGLHVVWSGVDTNPGFVYDFIASFSQTPYQVDGVKITIDTTISLGWDEIDAVRLTGSDVAACTGPACPTVPVPASIALLGIGLAGLRIRRDKQSA